MLKERAELIRTLLYVVEISLVSVNFFAIYLFALNFQDFYSLDLIPAADVVAQPGSLDAYMRVYWLALILWSVLLRMRGEYHHIRIQTYYKIATNHLMNGAIFFALFSSAAFLLKYHFLSRMFIVVYTVTSVALLLAMRLVVLGIAYRVRRKGYNYRNLLLVGTGRRAQEFMSLMAKHTEWGYRITGLLDKDPDKRGKRIAGYPVIGVLEDLPKLLEEHVIDEVVFVMPRSWIGDIEKCILYCEAVGVPATLSTDFFDLEIASGVPKEMDGFTYLTFETRLLKEWELIGKRIFDIMFSSLFLVLSAPLMLAAAGAVKVTSNGPVFFKQVRCGRNGRKFVLYKFRSMVIDAEKRLAELRDKNEMSGPVFKITDDPRVTLVGKILRMTSLDEFPQFWNVFKGDMSLVGPRPPLPSEVEQYEPWQRRRLSMKPGITCIWQVSGRSNIDFEEWMKLDLQYIDRWSIWLDFKIIILTFRAVLMRHGAK